jgi:hemolysin activation/secretion protein
LYRVGYSVPVGPYATKLIGSLSRNVYVLGGDFRDLDASGHAKVSSASVVQPLLRGRLHNLMLIAGMDRKELLDRTGASDPQSETIDTYRIGLLGSRSDSAGRNDGSGRGSNTTFSVLVTEGKAHFAAADPVLNSKGSFSKLNVDVQRTEFFSAERSAVFSLSAQAASKNLRNPERISYGGPLAVRGYQGPSGTGDGGFQASMEFRQKFNTELLGPVTASAFYDLASVNFRTRAVAGITRKSTSFDSIGLGLRAGREGSFVASAQVAAPLKSTTGGIDQTVSVDEDRDPKLWVSLQVWF